MPNQFADEPDDNETEYLEPEDYDDDDDDYYDEDDEDYEESDIHDYD